MSGRLAERRAVVDGEKERGSLEIVRGGRDTFGVAFFDILKMAHVPYCVIWDQEGVCTGKMTKS